MKISSELSVILALLTFVVGCSTFRPDNSVVALQNGLASTDDFGGEWIWPTDQQGSSGPEIVVLAGQKMEKATIYFLGRSGPTDDGFLLQHFLYRHQEQLSPEYTDTISLGDFEPESEELLFDIQKMGIVSQSKCVRAVTGLIYCSIKAKYKYVESQLNMLGYWKGSQQDFETLVNNVITKLDEKIKTIDSPYSKVSAGESTVTP